jgi:2-amino-4-hydroxy-6-hydroxymethyldihydropteridine diphosphokinase
MYKYHLGLGSNIEPCLDHLQKAAARLKIFGKIEAKSSIFRTAPWGFTDQPEFYNAVIRFATALTPVALLKQIKSIEKDLGRKDTVRWGPRIIDIDIIWCDSSGVNTKDLSVPHPHFHERRFVLEPLRELTEDLHLAGKTTRVSDLLLHCPDRSSVQKTETVW